MNGSILIPLLSMYVMSVNDGGVTIGMIGYKGKVGLIRIQCSYVALRLRVHPFFSLSPMWVIAIVAVDYMGEHSILTLYTLRSLYAYCRGK